MTSDLPDMLGAQREHLSNLLEAVQRCVYFLEAGDRAVDWPLSGNGLAARKKDTGLFQTLSAFNERFAKLQDVLASALRHAALLAGEQTDSFLKVLAFFEKCGVVDSVQNWQLLRTARNLAAHDYETDYEVVAQHFNVLHDLKPVLYRTACKLSRYCNDALDMKPGGGDFAIEFNSIVGD